MNGIDMLFVAVGFVLLLIFVELWERYADWFEWDRNRRRERRRFRYDLQDAYSEMNYRLYLRELLSPGLIATIRRATRTMEKFHEAFKGQTNAQ